MLVRSLNFGAKSLFLNSLSLILPQFFILTANIFSWGWFWSTFKNIHRLLMHIFFRKVWFPTGPLCWIHCKMPSWCQWWVDAISDVRHSWLLAATVFDRPNVRSYHTWLDSLFNLLIWQSLFTWDWKALPGIEKRYLTPFLITDRQAYLVSCQ